MGEHVGLGIEHAPATRDRATSLGRTLTATLRRGMSCSYRKTSAKPPEPSGRTSVRPRRKLAGADGSRLAITPRVRCDGPGPHPAALFRPRPATERLDDMLTNTAPGETPGSDARPEQAHSDGRVFRIEAGASNGASSEPASTRSSIAAICGSTYCEDGRLDPQSMVQQQQSTPRDRPCSRSRRPDPPPAGERPWHRHRAAAGRGCRRPPPRRVRRG